jgi:hypothetical protein
MRVSERQKVLAFLRARWKMHAILDDSSDADDMMEMGAAVQASRYLYARPIHHGMKVCLQLNQLLAQDDASFKGKTRASKQTFLRLLGLIYSNPIFYNNSHNPQRPISIQLYCYLVTVGHDGNGAASVIIAGDLHIGAGTVTLYFQRVVAALISVKTQFIKWPSRAKRRRDSAQALQDSGFYCFGIIDGTHIYFSQAPRVDANNFYTRKKGLYGMNVQLIVDFDWYIIGYVVGWPGCAQDVTSFESSQFFLNPNRFFSRGESIMADKGYVPRLMLTVPFDDPELVEPTMDESHREKRVHYNDGIKTKRILIERVNARLKNRFTALKGVRLQIKVADGGEGSGQDFKAVNDFTVSVFVLHNFFVRHHDLWEQAPDPVEDQYIDAFQMAIAAQSSAVAKAARLAEFSQRELELAARELNVQRFTQHFELRPAPLPFRAVGGF